MWHIIYWGSDQNGKCMFIYQNFNSRCLTSYKINYLSLIIFSTSCVTLHIVVFLFSFFQERCFYWIKMCFSEANTCSNYLQIKEKGGSFHIYMAPWIRLSERRDLKPKGTHKMSAIFRGKLHFLCFLALARKLLPFSSLAIQAATLYLLLMHSSLSEEVVLIFSFICSPAVQEELVQFAIML